MTTMAATVNTVELMHGTAGHGASSSVETPARPESGISRIPEDTPVPGTTWRLATELRVDLDYSPLGVTAWSPIVDDYGYGADETQAVYDLLLSLVDFRDSLDRRSAEGNLSEELTGLLSTLNALLTHS